MTRQIFRRELTESRIEMEELGLSRAPWPVGRAFLAGLVVADIAATTLTLLAQ